MHPDRNKDYSQPYFNSDNLEPFFYVKAVFYILAVGCYMLGFFVYLPKYLGEMHDLSTKWKQHETAMM
jgi:hypothetical protein